MVVILLLLMCAATYFLLPRYRKYADKKLIEAVNANSLTDVKKWLWLGADVNTHSRPMMHGDSRPLDGALRSGNTDIVRALVKHGADITPLTDNFWETPPPICCATTVADAQILIDAGADWKRNERWLISGAICDHNCQLLRFYLDLGATLDSPGDTSPLTWLAERYYSSRVLDTLIEYGADVNSVTPNGDTPLHHAVRCRNEEMVQKLLAAGARADVKDKQGKLPSDVAEGNCKALLEDHMRKQAQKQQ